MIDIKQAREVGIDEAEFKALNSISDLAINALCKIYKSNADNLILGAPETDCTMRVGIFKGLHEAQLILKNIKA